MGLVLTSLAFVSAAPDPNFHIYIAYGQSNMAGAGDIRNGIDNVEHPRYKMFNTNICSGTYNALGYSGVRINRPTLYEVYPAIPPMFHCTEGLSVADWFGRALADSLPGVTVAVIPVAVGGTKIELFDKDKYADYLSNDPTKNENDVPAQYLVNFAKDYGSDGNAHARIVETAQKAMEKGVIKGIIFHQGESGAMSGNDWVNEVKKTRDDILEALNLSADTVPFLAGEMLRSGCCYKWSQVPQLPNKMINTYVVSSEGLTGNGKDSFHFGSDSYKEFGKRYADMMLAHGHSLNAKTPSTPSSASTATSSASSEPEVNRKPYNGQVANLPGKIEVEHFDEGGEGISYHDTDEGNNACDANSTECNTLREGSDVDLKKTASGAGVIGWFANDEWLEYTVNVTKEGVYTLYVAAASSSGGKVKFSFMDELGQVVAETDDIDVDGAKASDDDDAEEDYSEYAKTKGVNVKLPAGKIIVRMTCAQQWIDVDYFNLAYGENAKDNAEIGQEVEPEFTPVEEIGTSSSSSEKTESIFADRLHMRSSTVEDYDVFDMQGNFIGRMSAYSMSEAFATLKNSNVIKMNGTYFIRNKTTGYSKSMRIVK